MAFSRDRDTDGNGSLDEKLWALHDAEGNTTALVDNAANVVERIAYDVDGRPTAMTAAWVGHGVGTSPVTRDARASVYNFEFLSEGNRWQAVFYDRLVGGEYAEGGGLSMTADGQWINTRTGRLLAPNAAITSSGNPYDPHMDSYSESWGWQALGYAGVAALTFATGGAGALAYLGVGTIGGAAIGGTYSYTNGGDFWSGAEAGAMVGSFVGGVPGLFRGAEALAARGGTFIYNESLANVRWLRNFGNSGPFTPAAQLAGGGTFAGAFGGEAATAAAGIGGWGGANVNWGGLFANALYRSAYNAGAYRPYQIGDVTVASKVRLAPSEYSLGRQGHFDIANDELANMIRANRRYGNRLVREYGISFVKTILRGKTPENWVWHHAVRSQAGGEAGWLYLVPSRQHWGMFKLLHPDGYGGYTQWAIPAGAPLN